MKNNIIIINDTLGVYGGTQTQILRMCRWFAGHGCETAVICESAANTEITNKLKDLNVPFHEIGMSNVDDTGKIIRAYHKRFGEHIKVINFTWNHYLDVETVKTLYRISFSNFLYCVHPKAVYKGSNITLGIVKKVYMGLLKKWLLRMNQNRAVLFMDEADIESSEKYFDINFRPAPEIFRIPMDFKDNSEWENSALNSYENNIIMTVSRAEFPFKGYMLGLIDDYEQLFKDNPKIKLEIVSSGDDFSKLEAKIKKLDKAIQESIVLYSWMPNDKLQKEIENCKVYIGMGTTILDASRIYRPAIPVRFYTIENYAEHFIGDRPEYLVAPETCEERAINLLREALNWDKKTYLQVCEKSYKQTRSIYDEDIVLRKWFEIDNVRKKSILSFADSFTHYCYQKVNRIRFKNIKAYDYEKLEKEK